jgi:coenzyme Q-binding protein COQ10
MDVSFSMFSESYTSRLTGYRDDRNIVFSSVGGPFRRLEGTWLFEPASEFATDVRFKIGHEYRNRIM